MDRVSDNSEGLVWLRDLVRTLVQGPAEPHWQLAAFCGGADGGRGMGENAVCAAPGDFQATNTVRREPSAVD